MISHCKFHLDTFDPITQTYSIKNMKITPPETNNYEN